MYTEFSSANLKGREQSPYELLKNKQTTTLNPHIVRKLIQQATHQIWETHVYMEG
jgi:hypothetical protein